MKVLLTLLLGEENFLATEHHPRQSAVPRGNAVTQSLHRLLSNKTDGAVFSLKKKDRRKESKRKRVRE